jgi:glutamate N-acetyltransferase / amino-acid N-acetyltransferase
MVKKTENALHLLSPVGFLAAGVRAGIKSKPKNDVGLLVAAGGRAVSAAAVFTTNPVHAAPVVLGLRHIRRGKLRGVVLNSGNANACTGKQGLADALEMCGLAAEVAGGKATEYLPCSTGIIGHLLPMAKVRDGIVRCGAGLGSTREHAEEFTRAILTTDTRPKAAAVEIAMGKLGRVRIAGVCKGAGMIGPRLSLKGPVVPLHATMLAFLTTDAEVEPGLLGEMLEGASATSFNAMLIDDHMSTNDTAVLLASGASGVKVAGGGAVRKLFEAGLAEVCRSLAYQIAADGEGATKVFVVTVEGAKTDADAMKMARAIAASALVKCAIHGNDPNWGRIVSGAGLAGIAFRPEKTSLVLQGTRVFAGGVPAKFDAGKLSGAMDAAEVTALLRVGAGKGRATVYTCDFSKEYVTINADYHT